ncbi:MAG: hypothetical protein LKI93_03805 [Bifidobacteriaceae bacterium]|jgi:hypothetical protein|nr:hypothetical protein [Bifidobacteriaceae bacterium]MCI1914402.1 hypothetical protein [Bifidobacteriaceae bacterium]MCI1935854.1 hypothetical protein [Bifidobacteriaceae bacterium]
MRKWKIIASVTAAVLAIGTLIALTVVRATWPDSKNLPSHTGSVATAQHPGSTSSGLGSDDDSWSTIPAKVTDSARQVVTLLVTGWHKTDGKVNAPSTEDLISAGMSKSCAASYEPVWNRVFIATKAGSVDPGATVSDVVASTAIIAVSGEKPYRTWSLDVTATVRPQWQAADGSMQTFPLENDDWTVTVSEERAQVTGITEPDQMSLGFRIPADLTPPQSRTQEESE